MPSTGYTHLTSLPESARDLVERTWQELCDEVDNECCDNYRWAVVGDPVSERHYDELEERGCCGSTSREVTDSESGLTLKVGINYGH